MERLNRIYSYWDGENTPSHKIVLEWEQILSKELDIKIVIGSRLWDKICWHIENWHLTPIYHNILPKGELRLVFEMCARLKMRCQFDKNTIPVIIDYWLEDKFIPQFFEAYGKCPLILVTNREVYELLNSANPPVPVEHWPLSFPDQYAFKGVENYKKEYEFTIIGRPNPFFVRMLNLYCDRHPDFTYIMNNGNIHDRKYYTNRGDYVAEGKSRESYLDMIRKTRISCYTTPGLDESKKDSDRFNQVTPRVMELLCNGCHVIGHYPMTADVKWYRLNEIVPNINTYDEFEYQLDRMRVTDFDIGKMKSYMSRHYTSVRASMLTDILKKHNIKIGQKL